MKLIDKDAVVAEIEKRIKTNKECMLGLRNLDYYQGKVDALNDTISFLDTLEMKDVDLDYIKDELDRAVKIYKPVGDFGWGTLYNIAIHFFELGLSTQLSWQDVKRLAEIGDTFMNSEESDNLSEEEYYTEILNKFKAQKGEKV